MTIKRKLLITGVTALLATTVAVAEEVRIYNWSDYIDEKILVEFTAETGIKVVYDVFDSNELLETKLLAGSTGYDVVVPSHAFLARQISVGIFDKLDQGQLPNQKHMWKAIEERMAEFDPGNAYSVNYMWGTTGIGYVKEKVEALLPNAPTSSWALVFDPANAKVLAECGIFLLDAPTEVIPSALRYLGYNGGSQNLKELEAATELLSKIRPYVRKFHSSEYISALANGDICVAIGWSGDILQARDRAAEAGSGITVEYVIPKEGAQMWFDQLAIPADAPNKAAAHKFIDYIMRPEVIAKASNYVYYANGNLESQKLLEEDVLTDTAIYPDEETVNNLFVVGTYSPKFQRQVNRAWTKIKTGQ